MLAPDGADHNVEVGIYILQDRRFEMYAVYLRGSNFNGLKAGLPLLVNAIILVR